MQETIDIHRTLQGYSKFIIQSLSPQMKWLSRFVFFISIMLLLSFYRGVLSQRLSFANSQSDISVWNMQMSIFIKTSWELISSNNTNYIISYGKKTLWKLIVKFLLRNRFLTDSYRGFDIFIGSMFSPFVSNAFIIASSHFKQSV